MKWECAVCKTEFKTESRFWTHVMYGGNKKCRDLLNGRKEKRKKKLN